MIVPNDPSLNEPIPLSPCSMTFPTYIILSDSEDESPMLPDLIIISDSEEEMYTFDTTITTNPINTDPIKEESEEDSDEEPEEEENETESQESPPTTDPYFPQTYSAPTYLNFQPNHYYSGGPRTIRTARKSVHPPQMAFASTSTPAPIIHSPSPTSLSAPSSPSDESSLPSNVPTTPLDSPISPYANISLPVSPYHPAEAASVPTSSTNEPYTPLEPYAPVSSSPGMTAAEWLVYTHQQSQTQTNFEASPSTHPPPPINEDQIIPAIIHQATLHDLRIEYLEHAVESLGGLAQMDMIENEVMHMNHLVQNLDQRTQELNTRVLTPGAYTDRLSMIEFRLGEMEWQIDTVLSEMRSLHEVTGTMLRMGK